MALPSVNPVVRAEPPTAHGRIARAAGALAWAAGPLVLSRVPPVVRLVPALAVLRGPVGIVLGAVALAVAAAGLAPSVPVPRVRSGVLFALAWAFLLTVGLSYTLRLRVSGDEPHYLLMAQS